MSAKQFEEWRKKRKAVKETKYDAWRQKRFFTITNQEGYASCSWIWNLVNKIDSYPVALAVLGASLFSFYIYFVWNKIWLFLFFRVYCWSVERCATVKWSEPVACLFGPVGGQHLSRLHLETLKIYSSTTWARCFALVLDVLLLYLMFCSSIYIYIFNIPLWFNILFRILVLVTFVALQFLLMMFSFLVI